MLTRAWLSRCSGDDRPSGMVAEMSLVRSLLAFAVRFAHAQPAFGPCALARAPRFRACSPHSLARVARIAVRIAADWERGDGRAVPCGASRRRAARPRGRHRRVRARRGAISLHARELTRRAAAMRVMMVERTFLRARPSVVWSVGYVFRVVSSCECKLMCANAVLSTPRARFLTIGPSQPLGWIWVTCPGRWAARQSAGSCQVVQLYRR